ncbi:RHOBTB1_2 [Mytilus edulis]|uniref:RHOBTB1_2 n=1 Tax=Mytilus edulis TaxID=6550 RepID=A0A8S3Q995_MYTED|nr:RHOBTB1_2 [Mytilus edulis]
MIIEAQSNGIELSDEDFQMQVYIKESDYLFVRDILTHKDALSIMNVNILTMVINVELQVGEQGISFDHEDWKKKATIIKEFNSDDKQQLRVYGVGEVINKFPTITLNKSSSDIDKMKIFWFNDNKIIANRICLPEYTDTTMSFMLAIAQGINLHGSGEIKGEICIDPAEIENQQNCH